jgi:ribonuclease BN (tRNA processing enzyme)
MMRTQCKFFTLLLLLSFNTSLQAQESKVPDTGQDRCFGDKDELKWPAPGSEYHGQDAQFQGPGPRFKDNGDGTVSDLITGLMWQKTPDFVKRKQTEAGAYAKTLKIAGHKDWRLPTIKELFSIADFRGNMHSRTPYIDTKVFDFKFPESKEGEQGRVGHRNMDAQYCTSTIYLGRTMRGDESAFGFNFADGRIKSYPLRAGRYIRCVRNGQYAINKFVDQKNGTILDKSTGLTWSQANSARTMTWKDALAYARSAKVAGHSDWRLPNVKELQSIVNYNRAPDAVDTKKRGVALDSIFKLSDPKAWAWSSTTHIETGGAYYVCFGLATSALQYNGADMNAHGAGAVRSDPKSGDPSRYSGGLGPQKDEIRILNYVFLVRGGSGQLLDKDPKPGREPLKVGPTHKKRPGQSGPSRQPGRRTSRFLERFDKNGDGKVTRREFTGPRPHFHHLDKNGDGVIDSSEVPSGPPGNRGQRSGKRQKPKEELKAPEHKSEFSVLTIGTGAPKYNPDRAGPCTVIQFKGSYFIIDTGLGTQARLIKKGISLKRVSALMFTHHHLDHNEEFAGIFVKTRLARSAALIYGPPSTKKMVDFMLDFYNEDMVYRLGRTGRSADGLKQLTVTDLKGGERFDLRGLKVSTTQVNHTIHTVAYRFQWGAKSIVVSGDLSYSESLIKLAKGADVLVIDSGAVISKGSKPRTRKGPRAGSRNKHRAHASLEEVSAMATKAGVAQLVLTHFGKEPDIEACRKEIAKSYKGKLLFAKDLMEFAP